MATYTDPGEICFTFARKRESEKRELAGIVDAVSSLDLESGVILMYDQEEEREVNGQRVSVLPVWKWLLEEKTPAFQ